MNLIEEIRKEIEQLKKDVAALSVEVDEDERRLKELKGEENEI